MKFNEIKEKLAKLELQFSEKEKEANLKKSEEKEKKEHAKGEEEKEKKELKEKKFKERFDKHFSEGSKGIHEKMCNLEEQIKSHGDSIEKLIQMNEHLLKKEDK